jgi:NAD(P)-dependent dehydrogenase (short-subunit alcohol dehydrogenase family)
MNQRVIITAAAAGIGRAIAVAFAESGANVRVCDVDDTALNDLTSAYPDISGTQVDVTDENALNTWFEAAIAELGGIDVLVNNAGVAGPTAPVEDVSTKDWRQCFAVCMESHMMTCRMAVPLMKAQKSGAIINISSGAGLYGYPFRTPYASAKWAIIGFSKSLAAETGPFNITVNAICPGAVSGPRIDRVIAAEAKAAGRSEDTIRAEYAKSVSMRRFVEPEEIADMAIFLASPAAKMVNGQAIAVDGHAELYHSE